MRNRLNTPFWLGRLVAASLASMALLCCTVQAAEQASPNVSKNVAKPLKAAQEALTANNYDEAIQKVKEAQSASGEKTAYDTFAMNILLLKAYSGKHDNADVFATLASMVQSQYATAEQKRVWYKSLSQYYFQEKDYNKALEYANQAVKSGQADADTMGLIAKSQYLSGKYKDAAATMQEIVSKQEKPDEESLKQLWVFDDKAGDKAGAAKAIEKLVAYYPKPEYWAQALASLVNADTKDERLQLNVYRLMNDVGVLKRGIDYGDMADIALDQGYPGETLVVLQKAFSENVWTDQRDKDRYQHLLDGAKQRAAKDEAALPDTEKAALDAPTGDKLVQVGAAYLSYGQTDKAVAAISKGIAKGGLKYPDEDYLLLGIAQLRSRDAAAAQKSFEKVSTSSNSGYARLGKLWALHAGAHNA